MGVVAIVRRKQIEEELIQSYEACYNINRPEKNVDGLVCECDYFEHSEKYVVSQKARLWAADGEEFLYLYSVDEVTQEILERVYDYCLESGKSKMKVGPDHMYSYITAVVLCDHMDRDIIGKVKRMKYYKSFRLGFYGWMNYRIVVASVGSDGIEYISNHEGKSTVSSMKKVLKY